MKTQILSVLLLLVASSVMSQKFAIDQWQQLPAYDEIIYVTDSTYFFKKDDKYGYAHVTKGVLHKADFYEYKPFREGMSAVRINDKCWGFIDLAGNRIGETYLNPQNFSEGLAAVEVYTMDVSFNRPRGYGYINKQGKLVIPYAFSYCGSFSEGLAPANGGYINTSGQYVHTPAAVMEKLMPSKRARKNFVLYKKRIFLSQFIKGLAVARTDGDYFFINKQIEPVNDIRFTDVKIMGEGIWGVKVPEGWRVVDSTGNWLSNDIYEGVLPYSCGLALVVKNGKRGYINEKGEMVIQPQPYAKASFFVDSVAIVVEGTALGYINIKGEKITPAIYDKAGFFSKDGYAQVEQKGKTMLINRQGETCFTFPASAQWRYYNNFFIIKKERDYKETYLHKKITSIVSLCPIESSLASFCKQYVDEQMEQWRQRGEFESEADHLVRIRSQRKKQREIFEQEILKQNLPFIRITDCKLGAYDAENECFDVEVAGHGTIQLPVEKRDAPDFKNWWQEGEVSIIDMKYSIEDENIQISMLKFYYSSASTTLWPTYRRT